jgi:3-hydroxyacyl-CoA dehydrogenase
MRRLDETYKRIVIAGGGQIGERLAEAIESRYQVKIIEMNPARCRISPTPSTAPWCCRAAPRTAT